MHSLICVDETITRLSQALIWADGRSNEQAKELKRNRRKQYLCENGAAKSSNVTTK